MAQSSFEVSEFMAKIDAKGSLAKRNRFSVEIKPPNTLVSDVNPADIEFLIKTVQFPGRSFGTANYRYGGKFGLEVPYEMTEEPVALTFQGTNDWSARKFWYDWLEHIQSTNSYNMQYYKEFIGTVKISVYDDTQEVASYPTHKVALMEAFDKEAQQVIDVKDAIEELRSIEVRSAFPDISKAREMLRDIVQRRSDND